MSAVAALSPAHVNSQPTPFGYPAGAVRFGRGPRIPVFQVPGFPIGGQARFDFRGEPIIIIDAMIQGPFRRFVLAHEYAHHDLGHIDDYYELMRQGGLMAVCFLSPHNELDADAWATLAMREEGNAAAVQAAFAMNNWQGFFAAPCYPPGFMRAQNIQRTWFGG